MDNEEEKKEDKGEHINLKVKDQVRAAVFSLAHLSRLSSSSLFFRAVYALSFERERKILFFFFQNSGGKARSSSFSLAHLSLSLLLSLTQLSLSLPLRSRKTTGQRRGALQGEDGHQVQEGAQFLRAFAGFLF
jgi:hypothetical protein